jgi:N-ethylmaleimide reductase
VSRVSLQEGGKAPVAPSAILGRTKTFIEGGFAETSMPRVPESDEIKRVVPTSAEPPSRVKAMGLGRGPADLN